MSTSNLAQFDNAGDSRINSLDFIRGVAVMGILVANIVGLGQPLIAAIYPGALMVPHSSAEDWMWVVQMVTIDGKMRGLFTVLFGASMVLFLDRAQARKAGKGLQARRLLWLGLFGLIHYFLVWRGDILFMFACVGLLALLFTDLPRRKLLALGLAGYLAGAVLSIQNLGFLPMVTDGELGQRPAFSELASKLETEKRANLVAAADEGQLIAEGRYSDWVAYNVLHHADGLAVSIRVFLLETLPLMLVGMSAYRYGLFEGGFAYDRQVRWGWRLLAAGTALTIPVAIWAKTGGLTYYGTLAAALGWSVVPRLLAILGLLALLASWGQVADGWLARRVSAAGRAAFTNYLGTSLVMLLIFHGWAGGLYGQLSRSELYIVALIACALMLLWSEPWLARFRYGPLEWLWRCLTHWRLFPIKR